MVNIFSLLLQQTRRASGVLAFLVISLVLILIPVHCTATNSSTIAQEKSKIKVNPTLNKKVVDNRVHTKEINSLIKRNSSSDEIIYEYLSTLKSNQLLELAYELAEEDKLDLQGIILLPHLRQRWREKFSLTDLNELILDNTNNPKFRAFLIDVSPKITPLTLDQSETFEKIISEVASNKDNDPKLRRYALLQLGKLKNKAGRTENDQMLRQGKTSTESSLKKIFSDPESTPEVKGASITAMRRTNDPSLLPAIQEILVSPESHPALVVRHALVSAAKSKHGADFVTGISNIAKMTQNTELYSTAIYSLGIIGDISSIMGIIDNYGRFANKAICRSALRKNIKIIKSMLEVDKPSNIIKYAIEAIDLAGIAGTQKMLEIVAQESQDIVLRQSSFQVIQRQVKQNNAPDDNMLLKWEDK